MLQKLDDERDKDARVSMKMETSEQKVKRQSIENRWRKCDGDMYHKMLNVASRRAGPRYRKVGLAGSSLAPVA